MEATPRTMVITHWSVGGITTKSPSIYNAPLPKPQSSDGSACGFTHLPRQKRTQDTRPRPAANACAGAVAAAQCFAAATFATERGGRRSTSLPSVLSCNFPLFTQKAMTSSFFLRVRWVPLREYEHLVQGSNVWPKMVVFLVPVLPGKALQVTT